MDPRENEPRDNFTGIWPLIQLLISNSYKVLNATRLHFYCEQILKLSIIYKHGKTPSLQL